MSIRLRIGCVPFHFVLNKSTAWISKENSKQKNTNSETRKKYIIVVVLLCALTLRSFNLCNLRDRTILIFFYCWCTLFFAIRQNIVFSLNIPKWFSWMCASEWNCLFVFFSPFFICWRIIIIFLISSHLFMSFTHSVLLFKEKAKQRMMR